MSSRSWRADVRAVLPAWIVARVAVAVGWFAAVAWTAFARDGRQSVAMGQGLFGWDGVFYRGIAETGYHAQPAEAVRFFPLYPLAGRALGTVLGVPVALVLIANVAALLGAAIVRRLAIESGTTAEVATRAGWFLALVPSAFVLVWGYAEGLFVLLSAGALLALRRRSWWWAAVLGGLAALTRPTGVLLAAVAVFAAWSGLRRVRLPELVARGAAVAGPVVGTLAYLWWCGEEYHDRDMPFVLQNDLRGGTVNPLVRVARAAVDLAQFDVHGLHLPFAIAMIVLAVVAARRLPGMLSAYSGATVVLALAANNLNSSERYAMSAVPLLIALALVTDRRSRRAPALAISTIGLVAFTALAWLQILVP